MIAPHDCDNSARCVTLAKRAGIPVISYDRLVKMCIRDREHCEVEPDVRTLKRIADILQCEILELI